MELVFIEIVSERLKELRHINGYTQKELSKFLNIERQAYSHYERGQRTPSTEILFKIAGFYDLTLDELLQMEYPWKIRETSEYKVHNDDGKVPIRLTKAELEMIHEFRDLPLEDQRELKEFVHFKKLYRDRLKEDEKKP